MIIFLFFFAATSSQRRVVLPAVPLPIPGHEHRQAGHHQELHQRDTQPPPVSRTTTHPATIQAFVRLGGEGSRKARTSVRF